MLLASVLVAAAPCDSASALQAGRSMEASELSIPVGNASLHVRTIGKGVPVIVLHGGPDFDYGYLLPELDRYKDTFRLIYYDQRGRGSSAEHVKPEDVTLASDVSDLDSSGSTFGWSHRRYSGTRGVRCWRWSMHFDSRSRCRT